MSPDRKIQEENREPFASPVIFTCIDFRAVSPAEDYLKQLELKTGQYFLFASAGASGNPTGFLETVDSKNHPAIIVADHEDCGFYKQNGGDSPALHHHNLETLGQSLKALHPDVNYQYRLLPIKDNRHLAQAAVIILGQPKVIEIAQEVMAGQNLTGNYDVIARPYELSTKDDTIWNDLGISMKLHAPQRIFIFDYNPQNLDQLRKDASIVAPKAQINTVMIR